MKFREFFQLLNEAPFYDPQMFDRQTIQSTDRMYNSGEYMQFTKDFKTLPNSISFNGEKFHVKRNQNGNYFEDVFFSGKIVGAVLGYEKKGNLMQISTVTQNKNFKGLVRHLYLNFYLNEYSCILSGDEQSQNGRGMWAKLIDKALADGKRVGAVNMVTGARTTINNLSELDKYYKGNLRNYNLTICN